MGATFFKRAHFGGNQPSNGPILLEISVRHFFLRMESQVDLLVQGGFMLFGTIAQQFIGYPTYN